MTALSKESIVAVVGSGVMGAGIAQIAAAAGHPVLLFDVRGDAVNKAIAGVAQTFQKLAAKGKMTAEAATAASARITRAASLSDLAPAGLVIEAILEDADIKRSLFADLEEVVSPECILASNTSSISITALGSKLKYPGRLAGMHFFNPVPLMELVEIVHGLATAPPYAECLFATAGAWGKTAVYAKSTPGFIVNRVARPYYAEGLRLLNEHAASPASIDMILRDSGGFRMGPFELMDLIGHDTNFAVTRSVFNAYYGDQRFMPSLIQQELVEGGFLGRKSGRGFYDYREGAAPPAATLEPLSEVRSSVALTGPIFFAAILEERMQKAEIHLHSFPTVTIALSDGRTATARALADSLPNLVLVDLARDFATAKTLAVARAASCTDEAYAVAVGSLQATGYNVIRLRDLPGLAVLRTVAMLANEAADAVNQGVCSVAGVNAAMRKGVNYPAGPLAWADEIGPEYVHTALKELGAFYGEDRYRISPLISEIVLTKGTFARYGHE